MEQRIETKTLPNLIHQGFCLCSNYRMEFWQESSQDRARAYGYWGSLKPEI
jgi:hypothetical protein